MTLQQIKTQVEQATGIEDISNKTRKREYVVARGMYMDLAYRFTTQSYAKIGQTIKRDHATVLYGLETFKNHLKYEERLTDVYRELHKHFKVQLRHYTDQKTALQEWVDSIPEKKYQSVLEQLEQIKI